MIFNVTMNITGFNPIVFLFVFLLVFLNTVKILISEILFSALNHLKAFYIDFINEGNFHLMYMCTARALSVEPYT